MQTMEVRHVPFANPSRAVSTFVWLLALSYLYLEITTDERAMGVFILPIVVGLQVIPAVYPGVENADPVLDSPWFWVHVSSLLFAYASFALAGVLGLTYMLQFKEIKKKHLGYFYTRLPSLLDPRRDELAGGGGRLGVPDGRRGRSASIWTAQARQLAPGRSRTCRRCRWATPRCSSRCVTWAVYSFALCRAGRWDGRAGAPRGCRRSGFVIVLLNFLPVSYFVDDQPHVPVARCICSCWA